MENVTVNISVIQQQVTANISPAEEQVTVYVSKPDSIPSGGTAGQLLSKASNSDYNTVWVTVAGPAWGNISGDILEQEDLIELIAASVPNVGANRVAVGAPITGTLTNSPNFIFVDQVSGFPGRAYVTVADALLGNISGYSIVRATQHVSPGDMELTAANGTMFFYTGAGSLRGAIDQVSGAWKILPGSLSNDMMLRADEVGVRIGLRSTMNTLNTYAFEVGGPVKFNSSLEFAVGAGTEIQFTGGGVANISHLTPGQEMAFSTKGGGIYFSTDSGLNNAISIYTTAIVFDRGIRLSVPTSNFGLSAGDVYQDTAANILANGDKVLGIKQ